MDNYNDLIILKNINKYYKLGSDKIYALNDINLNIKKSEFISIVGPSGSGKTTLVNIIGCLDNPDTGELLLENKTIFKDNKRLNERKLTLIRRKYFGYVFQKFFLIPTLTVEENIILPLTFYNKYDYALTYSRLNSLLDILELKSRRNHLPSQISGGEMQRVAIARALINNPEVLLADEPTGNLDSKRTDEIGNILIDLNKNLNITIILVTHNIELSKKAYKTLELRDGKILN